MGRILVPALAIAVVAGCAAFAGDDGADPAPVDGGAPAEAATDAASGGDAGASDATADAPRPTTGDAGRCPLVEDRFERAANQLVSGFWTATAARNEAKLRILDGAFDVETGSETGGAGYPQLITSQTFPPPSGLHCSFHFQKKTEFDSTASDHAIDIFLVELSYADGTKKVLRVSYSFGTLSVRDDWFAANGSCIAGKCPRDTAGAGQALAQDTWIPVEVDVTPDATTARMGDAMATLHAPIGPATGTRISFGLHSFAHYDQRGWFDDLVCQVACP